MIVFLDPLGYIYSIFAVIAPGPISFSVFKRKKKRKKKKIKALVKYNARIFEK